MHPNSSLNFLTQRFTVTVLTLWLAVTLAFIALHILPGDAIENQLVGSGATQSQIDQRRAELGLNQPLISQYAMMLSGLLRGDLGRSLDSDQPVTEIIGEQLGATIELALGALILAVVIGIALGMSAVLSRLAVIRFFANTMIALVLSSPVYWIGTLAIYLFSVWLKWLPSAGTGDLRFMILPWLTLGLSVSGGIARVTMSSLSEVRRADFIRTARAKGLRERYLFRVHLLRASAAPLITVIALQTGFLLGGTAVTEMLFVRQGIGQVLIDAINNKDYPIVQGIVVLGAITYSTVNFLADVLIGIFDPRVKYHVIRRP